MNSISTLGQNHLRQQAVRQEPQWGVDTLAPQDRDIGQSSMLGHYDAGFTLRTYTHATRQKQDEAAQAMGSFMAQVM